MPSPETLELLARALGIVARFETILAPEPFNELVAMLREKVGVAHVAVTRSERPGYFRVLASSRGELDSILPLRTMLSSSRRLHESVYHRREVFLSGDLAAGSELERAAAAAGVGMYGVFPIAEAPSSPVIAGLVVAFAGIDGQVEHEGFFAELASLFGPSVARGLLSSQRERALRILDATGDALVAWDQEGRITDVNRAAEHLIGAGRVELMGVPIQEVFGAIPTGPSSNTRLLLYTRDGRRITVSATIGQVQGDPLVFAHALLRDLSEVVAAEQDAADRLAQLRELTEQHMVLLDNAPLLIFRIDPESNEVLYLNRHAEHLFGVPASRALSTPGFLRDAHVDPEGATAFEEAVVVAKLGQVMPAYEAHLRRGKDETLIARGTIYPILSESGRVVGIEGILLDVTNERAVRSRLLQSDRLATVGMLAAGVAHEINNPAAFMLLGLDVLARQLSNVTLEAAADKQVRELIADLRDTGKRIVDIARDLRTFASPPGSANGRRTMVDVTRTIESALTITRAQILEKADIEVDLAPDLPPIAMEDGRLGQVLVNLLVNAAQAIAEARTQRGPLPKGDHVRIESRMRDDRVEITVQDTGIGIKREILDRVFVPFFTTKHADLGTGLGLAISRNIVEGTGGTISAESPIFPDGPSPGARFVIRLPSNLAPVEPKASSIAPAPVRRGRVLIVEDEVLLGKALAEGLSEAHDVVLASNGEEALGKLATGQFDAVLCDLKMPVMGGEELFRLVKSEHPEQARRFIFMTGVGFGPELERFLAEAEVPMLEKPFAIRRALAAIAERLGAAPPD